MDLILVKHKVLDFAEGKVKKPTDNAEKEKYKETNILAMNLIVDGVKDNLIPYISNIDSTQEMYTLHSTSLKNELRTIKMTKDDIVSSYSVRISRIRDELQAIDEVVLEKELMITKLGLPKSWSSFASRISS